MQRPVSAVGLEYNYAYYLVVFATHKMMMKVRQSLLDNDIGPRRYFYPSLNTLPFLKSSLKVSCPVSESIASRVLCLPLYIGLSKADVRFISEIISSACMTEMKS